jgi:hypothetical protein
LSEDLRELDLAIVACVEPAVGVKFLEFSLLDAYLLVAAFQQGRELSAMGICNAVFRPEFLLLSVDLDGSEGFLVVGGGKGDVSLGVEVEGEQDVLEERGFFEGVDGGEDLVAVADFEAAA